MSDLKEDIKIAKKIVSGHIIASTTFDDISLVYRTTNEESQLYDHYFNDKKRMFSVIGSGDQILNATLAGVEKIEAFDISRFPKYFLALKMAAIKALTLEEYVTFFLNCSRFHEELNKFYYKCFLKMCPFLSLTNLEFWQSLFKEFGWCQIYNSTLFKENVVTLEEAVRRNRYLQNNNFCCLKRLIFNQELQTHDGDLFDIVPNMQEADLIYLSNIVDYVDIEDYLDLLVKLKLAKNGVCITYSFFSMSKIEKMGFEHHFVKKNHGFMIYRH